MVEQVELALARLVESINEQPLVREYFALRDQLEHNPEIQLLNTQLVEKQKQLTLAFNHETAHHQALVEFNAAKSAYESHPLVANFLVIQGEVENLLQQIKLLLG